MMMNKIIGDDRIGIVIKPLLLDKELVFYSDRPSSIASPIFFMTATSPVVRPIVKGIKYIEHIRIDGSIDFLPYDGPDITDNFINFGWQLPQGRSYKRIDIFTGESRDMVD